MIICILSFGNSDLGFFPNKFNKLSDAKLFLINVMNHLMKLRPECPTTQNIYNMVKNIFRSLSLDWKYGWDDLGKSINLKIYEILNPEEDKNNFFDKMDILSTLFYMPFKNKNYEIENLKNSYTLLVDEFKKIEKLIGKDYILYVFKNIVDKAKILRKDFINNDKNVVKNFRDHIYHLLSSISQYSIPKGMNYGKLLNGILNFSNCLEGVMYELSEQQYNEKLKNEESVQVNNPLSIYALFEVNFPHYYTFSNKSKIHVFNVKNKSKNSYKNLPETLTTMLNKTHPSMRGCILYDYLRN